MSYNNWLDIDVLEDYLDGKLDAKAMHEVEKLSLEDPFVAEALAGLSLSPKRAQSLSLLQKQLQQRIAQKPIETKRWTVTSHRLSIGATAAVLFITVSLLFWMKNDKSQKDGRARNEQVKVDLAPIVNEPENAKTPADAVIDETISANKTKQLAKIKSPKQNNISSNTAIESESVQKQPALATSSPLPNDAKVVAMREVVVASVGVQKSEINSEVAKLAITAKDQFLIDFNSYVAKNNKYILQNNATGKSVQLKFDLSESGKPVNIRVENGLTLAENEEAIRLLKEGPLWNYKDILRKDLMISIPFL